MTVTALTRWLRRCGHTWNSIERALSIPARTLRHWIQGWRNHRLRARLLGRPPVRSPPEDRQALLEAVKEVGPGVGLLPLSAQFPQLPRREVRSILLRTRAVHRARGEVAHSLKWQPGAVWALDHAFAPSGPTKEQHPIVAVRDLGSGKTLEWEEVESTDGATTERKLRELLETFPPPLVIKMDNGSGCRDQAVRELLEEMGVVVLYSPPSTPSFNSMAQSKRDKLIEGVDEMLSEIARPRRYWVRSSGAVASDALTNQHKGGLHKLSFLRRHMDETPSGADPELGAILELEPKLISGSKLMVMRPTISPDTRLGPAAP